MPRISVPLTEHERKLLVDLAWHHRRDPQSQAAALVVEGLIAQSPGVGRVADEGVVDAVSKR